MFNKLFAVCLLIEDFEGPKKTEWGQTVAYFKDPDGNIWEVSSK